MRDRLDTLWSYLHKDEGSVSIVRSLVEEIIPYTDAMFTTLEKEKRGFDRCEWMFIET
jgi:hypothetical protein